MGTPITSSNVAQAIVRLVAAEALPILEGTLVMGSLVNRNYEQTLSQAGDRVSVPVYPTLTANNIAETGTVTTQVASIGSVEVTLNSHVETSFVITDVAKAFTQLDIMQGLIRSALYAISSKIETDILNAGYLLSTYNTAVGGAGSISEASVEAAETALWSSKLPKGEQKFLVVTGGTYSDLRLIPRFSETDKLGPMGAASAALVEASLGKIKDFNVIRSHFVANTGGPLAHNLAFGRDYLTLATRRLPLPLPNTGAVGEYAEKAGFGMRVIMSYNPNSLAQQVTVDVLYGVSVLRGEYGVELQTNTL